ncbi:hypothetical protein FHR81_005486 [Actinoalloteichus hoggarensis]|uniref:Uncharacterized protein n=1 Tax=Actinoalloteichus hoggarensis TaxID=1470176 RepID=A0A221VX01_9PSEU|nr:hypothetical protein [Actinoalloteichus hoggarensis]ASO17997.1 hypothetical protein AHOG_01660 [Actinoalloteichus hoggarensis]MBB5924409.1 hypothetical protein [Actinoalloteichus hoggarensis]
MGREQQTVRNGIGAARSSRARLVPAALVAGLALVVSGCSAGQITQTARKEPVINGINGDVGNMAVRDAQLLFPPGDEQFYPAGSDIPLSLTLVNTGTTTDRLVEVTSPSGLVELEGDTVIPGGTTVVATVDPSEWADAQRRLAEQEEQDSTSPSGTTEADDADDADDTDTDADTEDADTEDGDAAGDDADGDDTGGDDAADATAPNSTPSDQANPQNRLPLEDDVITVTLTDLINDLQPGTNLEIVFVFENAGQVALQVPMGPPSQPRATRQDDQH